MNNPDERIMLKALALAGKGIGNVEPNPAVGCVIVKNNRIIGRGFHKKFGGPHAEINALNNCRKKGSDPAGATMYVTLEPCCHFGKTPPCTDAIIRAKIKKVIAAVADPSPHVRGKGFKQLKKAGIEVVTGLCEEQAAIINAPVFKFAKSSTPWIIIKWAQSKDGFLARSDNKRWITGPKSRSDAHKLRRRADAILVGINTVMADDPLLTARPARKNKKLLRIALDSTLKIPLNCNLVKTAKKEPVLVFTTVKDDKKISLLKKKGVEIVNIPAVKGKCSLKSVLAELARRGIRQLLVEGGPAVITSFLSQKLADEIVVYISPQFLADNGKASVTGLMAEAANTANLQLIDIKTFNSDLHIRGFLKTLKSGF